MIKINDMKLNLKFRKKKVGSSTNVIQDITDSICLEPSNYGSKFNQNIGSEELKMQNLQQSKPKRRYNDSQDTSAFLKSILDRSSDIFSIKSKKPRDVEDVRKKFIYQPRKSTVLYDCDQDIQTKLNFNQDSEDMSLVKINKEIDSFLDNGKDFIETVSAHSSDIISDDMHKPPMFKPRDSKVTDYTEESSVPSMPKMSKFMSELGGINEKLGQIITVSEIHQPDEDELAERILSDSNQPFHINFDINDSEFKIDFSLIPNDDRCVFEAESNFSGISLNSDEKIAIAKGTKIKVLACDCNNHFFGYMTSYKQPMLIPIEKTQCLIKKFPMSSHRSYEIKDFSAFGSNEYTHGVMSINQVLFQTSRKGLFDMGLENKQICSPKTLTNAVRAKVIKLAYFDSDFNNWKSNPI